MRAATQVVTYAVKIPMMPKGVEHANLEDKEAA
jgi:hypothetical protein